MRQNIFVMYYKFKWRTFTVTFLHSFVSHISKRKLLYCNIWFIIKSICHIFITADYLTSSENALLMCVKSSNASRMLKKSKRITTSYALLHIRKDRQTNRYQYALKYFIVLLHCFSWYISTCVAAKQLCLQMYNVETMLAVSLVVIRVSD